MVAIAASDLGRGPARAARQSDAGTMARAVLQRGSNNRARYAEIALQPHRPLEWSQVYAQASGSGKRNR